MKCPSMFPKSGAPMEADTHFRALLNISFGVPNKGALPKVPFMESFGERCPVPIALLHLSKFLVYEAPPPDSRFP